MSESTDPKDLPDIIARRLTATRRGLAWTPAPDHLVDGLMAAPGRGTAPGSAEASRVLEWEASDVRGVASATPTRVVARGFDDGEIAISAEPHGDDGGWAIRGTVWVRGVAAVDRPITVVLLLEDHVIAMRRTESGAVFEFEEFLPEGWSIEVHLPSGRAITIVDRDV